MDYRRYFGFRAPRPIGDSTILTPQLENYSLFANPFIHLKKTIEQATEDLQLGDKSKSEDNTLVKRTTRSKAKLKGEEGQKVSKETSQAEDSFGIVLNFATVKPEQLAISFGKGNEIEVKVDQDMAESEYGSIPFSRNCTYNYELPDDVDKETLVALWTSDDYLIILPTDQLRDDLLKKCFRDPEEPDEFPVKDLVPSVGKSKDARKTKTSESEDEKPKTTSKPPSKKPSGQESDEEVKKVLDVNSAIPVYPVTRMLRPGFDIFMLRKYLVDLESYISTARKLVENASFVLPNSKSAERILRHIAKQRTAAFYEAPNFYSSRRKMKERQSSADSGYKSNEPTDAPSPSDVTKSEAKQAKESSTRTAIAKSEGKKV